jgi:GTP cyclohydrolase IA
MTKLITPAWPWSPGISFTALCEQHLLGFTGTLAYLSASRIVGMSKLARPTQEYAARPQAQERLGDQIADALMRRLDARGAGTHPARLSRA